MHVANYWATSSVLFSQSWYYSLALLPWDTWTKWSCGAQTSSYCRNWSYSIGSSNLTSPFWVHAFATTIYLINHLPTPLLKFASPYSLFYATKPPHAQFRIFSSLCYPCLRPFGRHKLEFKSCKAIFLGYSMPHKGYLCYDLHFSKVIISRHVIFDESKFPSPKNIPGHPSSSRPFTFRSPHRTLPPLLSSKLTHHHHTPSHLALHHPPPPASSSHPSPSTLPRAIPQPAAPTRLPLLSPQPIAPLNPLFSTSSLPSPPSPSDHPNFSSLPISDSSLSPHPTDTSSSPSLPTSSALSPPLLIVHSDPSQPSLVSSPSLPHSCSLRTHPMITRSMDGTRKPKSFFSQKYPLPYCLLTTSQSHPPEPTSFTQVNKDLNWRQAMLEEFNSLIKNQTWSLVPPNL